MQNQASNNDCDYISPGRLASQFLSGVWEIVSCQHLSNTNEKTQILGIVGTLFRLDDSGDITWIPSEDAQNVPLLSCETFETYSPTHGVIIVRFGAYAGHVIEFRVDEQEPPDLMTLKCDGWCSLICRRSPPPEVDSVPDSSYSLLPALEDGYFSDLSISASNGKQFAVHSCILSLSVPEIDWTQTTTPLSGLPEDVLTAILHYLYAECLPFNLTESAAHQIISTISSLPSAAFCNLSHTCELYLRNMALKNQIVSLVSDMHACGAKIIEHFNCGKSSSGSHGADSLRSNPAKLCYAVKQSVREAAVACVKLLVLCEIFTKRKAELSNFERLEIIRYAKSRLPIFMNQLHRLLQVIKSTFSGMSSSQRYDIATYIVPEIETILDTVSTLAINVKSAMEQIINILSPVEARNRHSGSELLTRSLNTVLNVKEVSKLRRFHQWITFSLAWLIQRKENFNEMTSVNKVRSVARNLDQLMEELPVFLLRLQDMDDKLEWREFKFCFKVGTSKVSGWIQMLLAHKEILQNVLVRFCDVVQRDEFAKSLVALELLDPSHHSTSSQCSDNGSGTDLPPETPKQHGYNFNLVQSLCTPPPSRRSKISRAALPLLRSGKGHDMVFEVVSAQEMDAVVDHTGVAMTVSSLEESDDEISTVKAHRVIVAARCDWFRRALQSGMRESIDRKILIHDTSPFLFAIFLDYLYCGSIDVHKLNVEQLADLMMLSDRYEVDTLKQVCEMVLLNTIDGDSVLYFLSLADQVNAKELKNACLTFISHHTEVMDSEVFEELPQNLQAEIYDLIIWVKPTKSETTEKLVNCAQFASPDTSCSSSMADIEDMVSNLRLNNHGVERSDSSSLEELPLTQDSARLESCVQDLIDIVGDQVPRHELVQLALAADYDVNRAANFYYERKRVT